VLNSALLLTSCRSKGVHFAGMPGTVHTQKDEEETEAREEIASVEVKIWVGWVREEEGNGGRHKV